MLYNYTCLCFPPNSNVSSIKLQVSVRSVYIADCCQVLIVLLEGVFNHSDACFRADECEGVEQLTQRVVTTIEQIVRRTNTTVLTSRVAMG